MRTNLKQALNFYYTEELKTFKESLYFSNMRSFANKLGFEVECNFGCSEGDDNHVYLGFSVVDNLGKTIWIDGNYEGYLSYSIQIAQFDKKGRIKFFSWEEDEDFIDSVLCITKELEKKLKNSDLS